MTDLLTQRYRGPSRGHRLLVGSVAGLLVTAALGWLLWAAFLHGDPAVTSALQSYVVTGPHRVRATVDVARDKADVQATCLLRASAEDHTVVGELSFRVGPDDALHHTRVEKIRTERTASSVELVGCTAPGQSHPQ